jgi:hypothetical protein
MNKGGILLIHGYYQKALPGVKMAVDEFFASKDHVRMPIGDHQSVAVLF